MSASASKKKRKELEEQGLSPKDVAAQKAKEQKAKTTKNILIVALVIVVVAAAVIGVISLVNAPSYDVKAAVATVGEEKITVPIYDYFYNLSASNFYESYSFLIQGGVPLSPAPVIATDLRGGVAVMIAALTAKGVTEISEIRLIERGYDDICGKLRSLGADIKKVVLPDEAILPRVN